MNGPNQSQAKNYSIEIPASALPADIQSHEVFQAAPDLFTKNIWLRGGPPAQEHYDRFDLYILHFSGQQFFDVLDQHGLIIASNPLVTNNRNRDKSGSSGNLNYNSYTTNGNTMTLHLEDGTQETLHVRDFSILRHPVEEQYSSHEPLLIKAFTGRLDLGEIRLGITTSK